MMKRASNPCSITKKVNLLVIDNNGQTIECQIIVWVSRVAFTFQSERRCNASVGVVYRVYNRVV